MIILRHGRFISGLRVFHVGEMLPETASAKNLVEKGLAEIVADSSKKSAKNAKKIESEKTETSGENDKSDS